MLTLLDLPEEIIIIIIKHLDTKSANNLYKTCGALQNIIIMKGVIRKCNLSFSTLSTFKSLQLDMIKGISENLQELNVCGIYDLKKRMLIPALKMMTCLKTLDVSYTRINAYDMKDIYWKCPSIRNITVNLDSKERSHLYVHSTEGIFRNFNNVHFVTTANLLNLSLNILRRSSFNTLKYTVQFSGIRVFDASVIENMCTFNHLCMLVDCRKVHRTWNEVLAFVKLEYIEFIIIEHNPTPSICVSPQFINFFSTTFKITSFVNFDVNREMYGSVAILIWNKKTTVFDEMFFNNLMNRLKEILTCEIRMIGGQPHVDKDMHCYDWFYIYQLEDDSSRCTEHTEQTFKKRRIVTRDQTLDYDKIFSEHEEIKLTVLNSFSGVVSLSSSSEYLNKITYLSLLGSSARYSNDFFNILFRCCKKLITLNVEEIPLTPCSAAIMRSIPLSQSIKNIRLVDKRIDFKTLFSSFSQCKTLENIYVVDSSEEVNELADLEILNQCVNLYTLRIHAEIPDAVMTNMRKKINLLKELYDHYIHLILNHNIVTILCNDPYLQVFNINGIKPV